MSFNSNGMEFYHRRAANRFCVFPVSIPNRMEFYLISDWTFEKPLPCFNSQRDGILLTMKSMRISNLLFQFPTGWNSTISTIFSSLCFLVSIPNGMEFYTPFCWSRLSTPVSIPNGMEFYLIRVVIGVICKGFQFPTGWNSTYWFKIRF